MRWKFSFRPKLLECLPGYDRVQLSKDVAAGLTVGILALPLAMAFAIASGAPPSAGIWTAIVAGFIISAFGGSRVQIGGPTGAFIPIVYGIVITHSFGDLLVATMLSGIFLLAMGFFRMGRLIRFIPVSVVIGFTNGIAIVIVMAQIKDFLGLQIPDLPAEFFSKIKALGEGIHTLHWPAFILSLVSLGLLVSYNRIIEIPRLNFLSRVPGPLTVLILATTITALFNIPVETIGSKFEGGIPRGIPSLTLPPLSLATLDKLISPAIALALLGAIESLLSARVADSMIEDRHDPNQELMAQGAANIIAPLFGGFAATGAIARTATNVRSGGRTPVAGIIHAFVLLIIVLVLAPLASYIPLSTLSAIVLVVGFNMGQWHEFRRLRNFSNNYRIILLVTFFVTVVFGLTVAVELGMVLSCLFFIYRMSDLTRVESLPLKPQEQREIFVNEDGSSRVAIWQIYGSLFFGASNKLETLLDPKSTHPEIVILDMQNLVMLDTTGLDGLEKLLLRLKKRGCILMISALNSQPSSICHRAGFIDHLGRDNLCANLSETLDQAEKHLEKLKISQE